MVEADFRLGISMENRPEKSTTTLKESSGSGFYDVESNEVVIPMREKPSCGNNIPASPRVQISKKPSLKKKNSWNPDFDGVIHMGYVWYYDQNAEKETPEKLVYRMKEERLSRILNRDSQDAKNGWKRYFAAIWIDGKFAWYKPAKASLYNKKLTGELEEVLFVPWRVCTFGEDVVRKLCPRHTAPYPMRPGNLPHIPNIKVI